MAKMNMPELRARVTVPGFTAEASVLKKVEPRHSFRISHRGTNHEEVVPQCTGSVGATTKAIVTGRVYLS
jgi:hypothetical protein